jgi:transcription antitermination factor NusG
MPKTLKTPARCPHTSDGKHVHIGGKKQSPECSLCKYHRDRAAKKLSKKAAARKPVKAKKAPKKAKPRTSTCLSCPGEKSLMLHLVSDMVPNQNGRLRCGRCAAREDGTADLTPAPGTWYVLQVEPGCESQVRADINKQLRIRNLERRVRRIMAPATLVERVGPRVGDTLAEGTYTPPADFRPARGNDLYRCAKEVARLAAAEIYARTEGGTVADYDHMDSFPGLRIQTFPGKAAGTIDWKVKEFMELETVRKVVRGLKYPGYMLIDMDYDEETAHVIKTTRNAWGLLLKPVVTGHLIKLSERTSQYAKPGQNLGWRWRVQEPEGGPVVAKGYAPSKAEARAAAEIAKSKAEEFKPTAMKSQEVAEALVAQTAVNQIMKDKEELNKAVCNLRPGDAVRVAAGAFRGCSGEVVRLVKNPKDKADVKVELKLRIMGVNTPATLPHHEVERTTRGDR